MSKQLEIDFAPLSAAPEAVSAVFATHDLGLGSTLEGLNSRSGGLILKAAHAADFTGKAKTSFELLAVPKLDVSRLVVIGVGKPQDLTEADWANLGGYALGQVAARKTSQAGFIVDISGKGEITSEAIAANLAYGALLRDYRFKKYQTKKSGEESKEGDSNGNGMPVKDGIERLVIHCPDPDKARSVFAGKQAVANGVRLARDLVNEPANVLGPVEFADRVKELERIGLEVEILDQDAILALKMNTLLAVSAGSARPPRVAVIQWHGAKTKRMKPLAFVGKGVVFDTGGISIKPSSGMEDMKGDMGGAACVTGLMRTLAERKAPVNAVGLLGLVENMPSGTATRPGDIVTSMSGQTVEILNTDAEGRLVLADVLWYAQERFKPRLIIDLATLTGAIMVALGKEFAGLYCNDDKLCEQLMSAAKATGEKVWRMPLDKSYDKMIESKNADMKNIGGRWAGACTAAAFLQRFIKKDTPWAHIDIAGTAMDAPRSDINTSWGSGWGVQLLDRFVADHFERGEK